MITYNETIQRGFKRKQLGNDNVWFNRHGYNYFFTQKTVAELKGCKLVAYWMPDTMRIELCLQKKHKIITRVKVESIEEFDLITKIYE